MLVVRWKQCETHHNHRKHFSYHELLRHVTTPYEERSKRQNHGQNGKRQDETDWSGCPKKEILVEIKWINSTERKPEFLDFITWQRDWRWHWLRVQVLKTFDDEW